MNPLSINHININSPYKVWAENEVIRFETTHGIRYSVDFDSEDDMPYKAYWLNLTNESHKPSPNDRLMQLQAIVDFFDEEIAMFQANKP